MAEVIRRKDNRGRVLKTGELQRKSGLYEFRYTDPVGKRRSVSSMVLNDLRRKEAEIKGALMKGENLGAGGTTVRELVRRFLATPSSRRASTMATYSHYAKHLEQHPFGDMRAGDVKVSDAKRFLRDVMLTEGLRPSSAACLKNLLSVAFQMACEEEMTARNPFDFKLENAKNAIAARTPLTKEQQSRLLSFLQCDSHYRRYYDRINLLLNSGLRVGEFIALTAQDIDFEQGIIRVRRQLVARPGGGQYISFPKTASGVREIPMLPGVRESLERLLAARGQITQEHAIDGVKGFLYVNRNGNPDCGKQVYRYMQLIAQHYNARYPEEPIKLTPHILRHTFCTNLILAGMNIRVVQYMMGHAGSETTLEIYAHVKGADAAEELRRVLVS